MRSLLVILSLVVGWTRFACAMPLTEHEMVTNLIVTEAVKQINFFPIGPGTEGDYLYSFQLTNRSGYWLKDFQFGYMCVAQSGTILKTGKVNMFCSVGPRTNLNAGLFRIYDIPSQTDHFVGVLLNFEIIDYVPPPSEEELAAARALKLSADAEKKAANTAKALKYNRELAGAGDAYGELRMGQRYRDGDGVARDLRLAREWLAKSAAQGDKTAQRELGELPEK
jgi:hypothetical protein